MPQTRQIIKKITLQSTSSQSPSQTRGVKIINLGPSFLWVAIGAKIHFFSAKVLIGILLIYFFLTQLQLRQEITSPLMNQHPILNMVLMPGPMIVWITDVAGYVSIWDAHVSAVLICVFLNIFYRLYSSVIVL
jgi:hypothetical protein